ncbi:DUF488 domain-containing protein [Nesterenkonia sp. HG001]|uniref:DUF488 domain-containing protein n=1 Tax=Nesterenkonia sp. HG001 TaxID=2983207 RepID=UPI002AC37D40|nr:DUF488 domain-containing protein [Nesterenkonia sp. HG001]MDZ5077885.1 DUF488 domain-containing protein [Nesterenkonia sp. HG001]
MTDLDTQQRTPRRNLHATMTPMHTPDAPGIIGIGYEGKTSEQLIRELDLWQIDVVVDVRLNPISRKKGLSKTALREALAGAGIRYEHRRELGNPKENRAGFWDPGTAAHQHARETFADILKAEAASPALEELVYLAGHERVALLCFEASERCCHRAVILAEVKSALSRLAAV